MWYFRIGIVKPRYKSIKECLEIIISLNYDETLNKKNYFSKIY